MTTLMVAVKYGETAIVNTLVDGGADVNVQENVSVIISTAVEVSVLYSLSIHVLYYHHRMATQPTAQVVNSVNCTECEQYQMHRVSTLSTAQDVSVNCTGC